MWVLPLLLLHQGVSKAYFSLQLLFMQQSIFSICSAKDIGILIQKLIQSSTETFVYVSKGMQDEILNLWIGHRYKIEFTPTVLHHRCRAQRSVDHLK